MKRCSLNFYPSSSLGRQVVGTPSHLLTAMLERSVLTMNSTRTARQISPHSEEISEASDLLANPSYEIIAGDVGQFTTQYYTTVEPQESALSPKDGDSSSDTSSSRRSKSSSSSSDDGGGGHQNLREQNSPSEVQRSLPSSVEYTVTQQKSTGGGLCGGSGGSDGSSVKHWSYEEQFKQVSTSACGNCSR